MSNFYYFNALPRIVEFLSCIPVVKRRNGKHEQSGLSHPPPWADAGDGEMRTAARRR